MRPCFNETTAMKHGDLRSDIENCAKFGFELMEIREDKLLSFLRRNRLEDVKELLQANRIQPVCFNAVHEISFRDKEGWLQTKELCEFLFYCGREIGCHNLEVVPSADIGDRSYDEISLGTAEALCLLSDIARNYDVRCAFEFIGFPNFSVNTFKHSLEIINMVDRDNVGILLDTFHFYGMGSDPEDILLAKGEQIFDVHIGDCPKRAPGTAQRAERCWPGAGDVPLLRILQNLKSIGYDWAVSVEMFDPKLWELPVEESFRIGLESTSAVMKAAGVLS